jgi:hypothetical protein
MKMHSRNPRGVLGFALASAASLSLCACGGGSGNATAGTSHAPPSSSTAHASGPHEARTSRSIPTRAEALAFADAVNLGVGDIPEASIAHRSRHRSSAREKQEYRACEHGIPQEHPFLERSSPKLERGKGLEGEEFTSAVGVVRDARSIPLSFRALQAPSVRGCVARVFTRNFSAQPVRESHWGHFSVSKLPVSAPGASATFGIRVSGALNIPYSEVSLPFYWDMLGFALGHTEVTLMAGSVTQPVPSTTEQELLTLLLSRARAHSL